MARTSVNCFLWIDYEDGPGGYRAVVLDKAQGLGEVRFASGDPVKDWAEANEAAKAEVVEGRAVTCMMLSSTTHFVFDVPGYRFNEDDDLELDPEDWTDGVLTPKSYDDDGSDDEAA